MAILVGLFGQRILLAYGCSTDRAPQENIWSVGATARLETAFQRTIDSRPNLYFSAAIPITINIVPTNTAIATPEYNMPWINAVTIMMFFLSGNSDNPYSPFNYESLLCSHPHAMANTPIKETYSTPLINIAVLMMFLLPENPYKVMSWIVRAALRISIGHAILETYEKIVQLIEIPLSYQWTV
jgi:hypothetical protein